MEKVAGVAGKQKVAEVADRQPQCICLQCRSQCKADTDAVIFFDNVRGSLPPIYCETDHFMRPPVCSHMSSLWNQHWCWAARGIVLKVADAALAC